MAMTSGAMGALAGNARAEQRGVIYGIALTDSANGLVDVILERGETPPELPDDDQGWEWADADALASIPVEDDPDAETYDETYDEGGDE